MVLNKVHFIDLDVLLFKINLTFGLTFYEKRHDESVCCLASIHSLKEMSVGMLLAVTVWVFGAMAEVTWFKSWLHLEFQLSIHTHSERQQFSPCHSGGDLD